MSDHILLLTMASTIPFLVMAMSKKILFHKPKAKLIKGVIELDLERRTRVRARKN